MTLTDVVFPAFLFITGMAIPLGLGPRLARGETPAQVFRHVLVRTLALLAVGVLMVNGERASPAGILSAPLWYVLMTVAVVLVWNVGTGERRPRPAGRYVGLALLVVLAFVYRSDGLAGVFQMRPHWWGILGLIGWAYLVGASLYLAAGDRPAVHVGAMALLSLLAVADQAGALPALAAVRPLVSVGSALGAHGALVVSGVVLTLALVRHRRDGRPPFRFVAPALGYAVALAAAALLLHSLHGLHPVFWFNKVRATVPWCLLSAAFTVGAWLVFYWAADVKGARRWPTSLAMAGENALVIYLLAPFLLSVFALLSTVLGTNPYASLGGSLAIGTLRSIVFAWVVVRLSGWMRARGVVLRF